MSKLAEQLRTFKIFNTHAFLFSFGVAGATDIGISYHRRAEGRMGLCQCNNTRVFSPSHKTNPDSHWSDRGCKSFIGKRADSFPKALEWASEKYGITEWANDPFSPTDKIPLSVLKAAKDYLKSSSPISAPVPPVGDKALR